MKNRIVWRVILAVIPLLGLIYFFQDRAGSDQSGGHELRLQRPALAAAQEGPTALDVAAMLDQEAGISAYFKSPTPITLSLVRGQFRTIEAETADYIIGSVAVPGYYEHFDAHVYVDRTGWILGYYPRTDPVAKMVDVRAASTTSTKLRTAVGAVAGAAGAAFSDVTYYDFRYPSATHILFVGEDGQNGRDFSIQLPSSYGYFERSWATLYNDLSIDGSALPESYHANSEFYGWITAAQLAVETSHTLELGPTTSAYGVLVVVYRVP